jgi:DNA-binding transcriptional ArsR family regulator
MARASTISDPFNAIAEPRRRHILEFIASEERSVNEIAQALELQQPSVSKHLQVLLNVNLVTVRRDGRRTLYRTNAETLRTIHDWSGMFAQHWRGQLLVYLRLLNLPVPSVYGPTADENPFAASVGV